MGVENVEGDGVVEPVGVVEVIVLKTLIRYL